MTWIILSFIGTTLFTGIQQKKMKKMQKTLRKKREQRNKKKY